MSLHKESAVEFADMQALLRFGYSKLPMSCYLLLRVAQPSAARAWLRSAPVTTAALMEAPPAAVCQVAFTAAGLRALEIPESVLAGFSEEFNSGMAGDENRSRRLGDTGANDPSGWAWGGPHAGEPHLLVLLYATPENLDGWRRQVQGDAFETAFELMWELGASAESSREPFGFEDGISQPEIDWWEEVRTGPHERDRYSNFLALGELALGYRNEYGLYTGRPLLEAGSRADALPRARDNPALRDLGCNGSYLVLRQLAQDVSGFWRYLDEQAQGDPQERERLGALMVGRRRDGTPVVAAAGLNQFTYDGDPHGRQCPMGAHIRRANPRTGDFPPGVTGLLTRLIRTLGFRRRHPLDDLVAASRFHRLVRRGRAYGPELAPEEALAGQGNAEQGLHFVGLGANISRQFEFLQSAWSMSAKFAGLEAESDPLLGNREPLPGAIGTDSFSIPRVQRPARTLRDIPRFVQVQGGAYFFLPGIRALRYIAEEG